MSKNISYSYPMAGGEGPHSYAKNSFCQRLVADNAKIAVDEAIAENFDIKATLSSFSSNSIRIADVGCSVGPNTFIAMQNIIDAVQQKYQFEGLYSQMPEFHVFYNDHVSNDFNTLFCSLPSNRKYFAAGVPGSFHGRLFPESFLHIVYSSNALHWLSTVPEELLDKTSATWNGGRIHYTNSPNEVVEVYAAQFAKDMRGFLDARSKEIATGGLMVLIMPSRPNKIPQSRPTLGVAFDLLGSSLMDMAKDGIIREDQVDKFNIPIYFPSHEEIRLYIENNGCFSVEKMDPISMRLSGLMDSQTLIKHLRAGFEEMISKNFGREIIDELYSRLHEKVQGSSNLLDSLAKEQNSLLIVLKRK